MVSVVRIFIRIIIEYFFVVVEFLLALLDQKM